MERKFLKDLGLADDVIEKVMAENGKDINELKSAGETAKTTLADLQKQIKDRDKQLEALKTSSGDNEALKKQITDLQAANKQAKTDYDVKLKEITLNGKIESALMGAKARDVGIARAALDMSKISLDGENVLGRTDQLAALQKDKAWLFGEDTPKNPPAPAGGQPPKTDAPATLEQAVAQSLNAQGAKK